MENKLNINKILEMSATKQTHYLTNDQRLFIVFLYKKGNSFTSIIKEFQKTYQRTIYNSTISDVVAKEKAYGSVETLDKSGRPSIYDQREERILVNAIMKEPTKSIRDIADDPLLNPKGASKTTINDVLLNNKVTSRVLPKRLPDLTKKHVAKRKKFSKDHLNWDTSDWELVIFSDESDLFPVKCGRQFVHLRENQTIMDIIPITLERQKELTIKVWGALSFDGVGPLLRYEDSMNGIKYRNILTNHLLPTYPWLESSMMEEEPLEDELPTFKFVHDKSSVHTSNLITGFMNDNAVYSLDWPPNSPDINIIENVWSYIKDELYKVSERLNCANDTWEKTVQIWNEIPLNYIQNLYKSLPNRMKELKNMKGGPIAY